MLSHGGNLTYRWLARPVPALHLGEAPGELSFLPRSIALLLARRGMDEAATRSFLNPALDDMSACDSLPEVTEAADRISAAVRSGEKIIVHGDYDADGITATALTLIALRRLGSEPVFFVPDRFRDGYGITASGVKACVESGAGLMISVDCGISDTGSIAELAASGIDTVVTDHHRPTDGRPDAVAVVNPHLSDDEGSWSVLSGAGVAFRTMQAVNLGMNRAPGLIDDLLSLTAIGTVCDVVPLTGDNRIIVSNGLLRMTTGSLKGLDALAQVAGVDLGRASSRDLAFSIGPRLNSSGRIGQASSAVKLLTTDDTERALELANELEYLNTQRRSLDSQVLDDARMLAARQPGSSCLVLASERWHQGVIGIAASRLVSEVGVPVVLVSLEGDRGRGSARSVRGISIHGLLEDIQTDTGILESFGGHHMAAGLTIRRDNLELFRDELQRRMTTYSDVLEDGAVIWLDGVLDDADYGMDTIRTMGMLEPFGEGNEEPVWLARSAEPLNWRTVGQGQHLSCLFQIGNHRVTAIGFNMSDLQPMLNGRVDLAFCLRENIWKGRQSIQLHLQDIRPAGAEV
jgi:single-stranded-DNA-specific exonuclease